MLTPLTTQSMDKVHGRSHPRLVCVYYDFPSSVRPHRPRPRLLDRIRRPRPPPLDRRRLLLYAPPPPSTLPRTGRGLEILPTHIRPPLVPRCARGAKVQCPGLQATAGAVPKGD